MARPTNEELKKTFGDIFKSKVYIYEERGGRGGKLIPLDEESRRFKQTETSLQTKEERRQKAKTAKNKKRRAENPEMDAALRKLENKLSPGFPKKIKRTK
jgi:hypothetical protein